MYELFRSPEPPQPSLIGGKKDLLFDALRRTPIGLAAKARLEGLFSGDRPPKKLEFGLSDELINGGRGDTQDLETRIVITICDSASVEDRMLGWKQPEILNVVGVHEIRHIVEGKSSLYADDCGCTFCPCHQPHFDEELPTRFQYSLIHPGSAGKAGWLDRYIGYFAAVRALERDSAYAGMCEEMRTANPVKWKKQSADIRKYEKANPPSPDKSDLEYGRQRAFGLYQKAVKDMADNAARFDSDGLIEDPGPYKSVLAAIDDYRKDQDFKLVP